MVPFIGVNSMIDLVRARGTEAILCGLADAIEHDFRRWPEFEKSARLASHSRDGVIELMPTDDGKHFAFKYVTGHPGNAPRGRQTVAAFGVLSDVATGYPVLISEMTIATALRTAATSALVARRLARPDASVMAIIGLGAQSEFQALAFKALLGIRKLRVYDLDLAATDKFVTNLRDQGFMIEICNGAGEATRGADVVTTLTADKCNATILSDNMIGAGMHINAVGGDCPGKTEIDRRILERSSVFVEYAPQTRVEGDIQQMSSDFPVTEFWEVLTGTAPGRKSPDDITLFDSVGFAIEDFSTLRYLHALLQTGPDVAMLDLIPEPDDPRDLFGMLAPTTVPSAQSCCVEACA